MRDTGWTIEPDGASGRWIGDEACLLAQHSGYWHVVLGSGGVTVSGYGETGLSSAKRAAEDALRKLCRDTLAALGPAPEWHCPHGIGHPETGAHGCDGCCRDAGRTR